MMYYIEDTNVISTATTGDDLSAAARPGTNRAQLEEKRRELEDQGFQHALTPLLLIEIINGLANAPSQGSSLDGFVNFNKTKNKLRILYPFDRALPKMLPHPHAFVLKTVLGVTSPRASRTGNNEESFNRWAEIVLCAQSEEEVGTRCTHRRRTQASDFEGISPRKSREIGGRASASDDRRAPRCS